MSKLALAAKRLKFGLLSRRYASHECETRFDWDWDRVGYDRVALVEHLVNLYGAGTVRYLEIGCQADRLFAAVSAGHKIGVDPVRGGTHRETSDAFFARNREIFDVIFIDGWHAYDQVHRDTQNAIRSLSPGGVILLHDLLPRSWKEHHVPQLQDSWTGDCWKVAFEIMGTKGLAFSIFDIDHGVGVVFPEHAGIELADMSDELAAAEFDYFASNLHKLPRVEWQEGLALVEERFT